jgi:hypothetical protein
MVSWRAWPVNSSHRHGSMLTVRAILQVPAGHIHFLSRSYRPSDPRIPGEVCPVKEEYMHARHQIRSGEQPQRIKPGIISCPSSLVLGRPKLGGLISYSGVIWALVDLYVEIAREQGVPTWLEAISNTADVFIYEHPGFRTVAVLRLGVLGLMRGQS